MRSRRICAAKEASAIYATRLKEIEEQRRSTAPGSGSDGTGTALDDHKTWGCLVSADALDKTCLSVYKDFGKALLDPAKCSAPANSGTAGCTMLADLKSFVDDNPELLLDMLQFVLGLCGLIPGVGEVCDAADAAVSFKRGDWVGGLLSHRRGGPGHRVPRRRGQGPEELPTSCATSRTSSRSSPRDVTASRPAPRCCWPNGSRKPIEQLRAGDKVVSTDPATGVTSAKPVTATIVGSGAKVLVTLTVKGAGGSSASADQVTATDDHPFWVPDLRSWVPAGTLGPGQWLRTSGGTWVQVTAVAKRTQPARVHNLSVADFRTYYVFAGDTPILVHNASQCFMPIDLYSSDIGQLVLEFRRSERIEGGREPRAGRVGDRRHQGSQDLPERSRRSCTPSSSWTGGCETTGSRRTR